MLVKYYELQFGNLATLKLNEVSNIKFHLN